jgi:hypothetical protein
MQFRVDVSLPMKEASIFSAKASTLRSEKPATFQNTVTVRSILTTSAYGILLRGSKNYKLLI